MKAAEIIAGIVKPLQTGAIAGLIALPILYRSYGFASSSDGYPWALRMWDAGAMVAIMALVSSLFLTILPKSLGLRKRGWWGLAGSVGLVFLAGELMPVVLPE